MVIFARKGYQRCETGSLEPGQEKIAMYLDEEGQLTHVARQLPDGWWTSKLGAMIDVEHQTLESLENEYMGRAVVFAKRARRRAARKRKVAL